MTRSRSIGVALASIILGSGVLAAAGFALASAEPSSTAATCEPPAVMGQCHITLNAYPDSLAGMHGANGGSHPDWVSYMNRNVILPANSLITMTINNYDGGGSPNNDYFRKVVGTIGNAASFNGGAPSSYWNEDMGHTFTMRGIPGNQPNLFISVPLPANHDVDTCAAAEIGSLPQCAAQGTGNYPKNPSTVTFTFRTKGKGVYQWNCEFPCGGSREGQFGYAMSTFGYMAGTVTVE